AFLCYFCLAGLIANRYGELRQTKAIGQNEQVELLCGTERLQDEKSIVDPLPALARQGGGKLLVPTSVIQRNLPLSRNLAEGLGSTVGHSRNSVAYLFAVYIVNVGGTTGNHS
ncbi:unnamed protein product, partial [Effrenium voratum]